MQAPNYTKIRGPYFRDGKMYVSISMQWWAFPHFYFKEMKKCNPRWYGWIVALALFPGTWFRVRRRVNVLREVEIKG